MAKPTDLVQGTLDHLILKTLSLGPMHGWAVGQSIQQISNDVLQVRGWNDSRKFGSGKNNFFEECLRGIAPYSNIRTPMP